MFLLPSSSSRDAVRKVSLSGRRTLVSVFSTYGYCEIIGIVRFMSSILPCVHEGQSIMMRQLTFLLLLTLMSTGIISAQTRTRAVKPGHWSGETAQVTVTKTSTTFDFGCASGETALPIRTDKNGAFRISGIYRTVGGAALPRGMRPPEETVFFVGTIKGTKMSLSIDFPNSERPSPTYELTAGTSEKELPRCS